MDWSGKQKPHKFSNQTKCSVGSCKYKTFFENDINQGIHHCKEEYISSPWDLISAIGGAIGLWLGWSVMFIGHTFVDFLKNIFIVLKNYDKK